MALSDDILLVLQLAGQTIGPLAVQNVERHLGHGTNVQAHNVTHAAELASDVAAGLVNAPQAAAIAALIATLDARYAPHP